MSRGRLGWFETDRDEKAEEYLKRVYKYWLWLSSAYPRIDGYYFHLAMFQIFSYSVINSIECFIMACSFLKSMHLLLFAMKYLRMFCYSFMTQLTICVLFTRRDAATYLYRTKADDFFNYDEEETEDLRKIHKETRSRLKKLWLLPVYGLLTCANMFLLPLIEKYYGGDDLPGDVFDNNLIFVVWSPHPQSATTRMFLNALFFCFLTIVLFVTTGGILLFGHLMESLIEQMKILNLSLSRVETRAVIHFGNNRKLTDRKWTYEDSLHFCLKQNIDHLLMLKRFKKEFEHYCSPSLISIFCLSTVFMAGAAFLLIKSGGNPFRLFTGISSLLVEVYLVGFFNTYGQDTIDESEKLRYTLYGLNWMTFDRRNKKTLNIMQVMTLRPMNVMAGGLADLNMMNFRKVMNSAYSFINLFLAVK